MIHLLRPTVYVFKTTYNWEIKGLTEVGDEYLEAVKSGTDRLTFGSFYEACEPEPHPEFPSIGQIEPICPYCNKILKKRPSIKTQCPHCKQPIFVKDRPSDLKKTLLTATQKEAIEEQWAIVYGRHDLYIKGKQEKNKKNELLAKKIGHYPSVFELEWHNLESSLNKLALEQAWGPYRNAKLQMAEIRRKEGDLLNALGLYLEVCYMDVNRPANLRPIKPKYAGVNQWTVNNIIRISKKLTITLPDIQAIFFKRTTSLHCLIARPLGPPKAWPEIRDAILTGIKKWSRQENSWVIVGKL